MKNIAWIFFILPITAFSYDGCPRTLLVESVISEEYVNTEVENTLFTAALLDVNIKEQDHEIISQNEFNTRSIHPALKNIIRHKEIILKKTTVVTCDYGFFQIKNTISGNRACFILSHSRMGTTFTCLPKGI